ncbi:MAG: hypothetical protein WD572_04480 [Gammaproteobacteria bacterium]
MNFCSGSQFAAADGLFELLAECTCGAMTVFTGQQMFSAVRKAGSLHKNQQGEQHDSEEAA